MVEQADIYAVCLELVTCHHDIASIHVFALCSCSCFVACLPRVLIIVDDAGGRTSDMVEPALSLFIPLTCAVRRFFSVECPATFDAWVDIDKDDGDAIEEIWRRARILLPLGMLVMEKIEGISIVYLRIWGDNINYFGGLLKVVIGRQSIGERSASIGERSAKYRRKVCKVRQIFSDHIAIESTIIAEYSLIQFVPV